MGLRVACSRRDDREHHLAHAAVRSSQRRALYFREEPSHVLPDAPRQSLSEGVRRPLGIRWIIRERVVTASPSDSWYEDGLAFVVFALTPVAGAPSARELELSQAVFVLTRARGDLLAVRVIASSAVTEEVQVTDLLADSSL